MNKNFTSIVQKYLTIRFRSENAWSATPPPQYVYNFSVR